MPKSGSDAADALPFTLNRRSFDVRSASNNDADDGLPAVERNVPLVPIVPTRCESLPTVNRLPQVLAYSFAFRLASRCTPPL